MKTAILFVLLILGWHQMASAQTSKTIVQLHQLPSHVTTLHLELPSSNIKIVKTKSSRVSVETTIQLSPGSPPLLEYLTKTGRYDLRASSSSNSSQLILALAKMEKVLVIKGEMCEEQLSFKIHVPERLLKVTTSYTATTASLSGK